MLKSEEYRKRLEEIIEELKKQFIPAEIIGDGVASFVYAEKENRAFEIYQSEDGVIIEYWENEVSRGENETGSYIQVAILAINWINNYEK